MISNPMASVTGRISEELNIDQFDHFRSSPTRASSGQADCTDRERQFSGSVLFLVLLPESPTVTGQYHCGKVLHSPSVLFHNTFSSSASGKAVGFGAPISQADRSKEENML